MRSLLKLAAALVVATALVAGCAVTNQESTTPNASGNERTFTVDVPAGATQLRVDTSATPQAGNPDVTVLVKDESGSILGTHTWALKDRTTDTLTVNVTGQARLVVAAKVIDGDASLDVKVTALVPNQPEVIVIQRTIVITQTTTTTTPTPTATPPASSTPVASTPAPGPTPAPTTNTTNNTTATNSTMP